MADGQPTAEASLPDLRETISRRVDLLGDDTRRILAAGSVLGRRFNLALVVSLTGLDRAVVEAALREAVAAEVVTDEGDGRYMFSHALVQDTLYGDLGPTRRARLHHRAAETLEELYPEWIAAIAHHHCCALPAGDRDRAVDYAWRAAADAVGHGAHEQAVEHYEQALTAARTDAGCCLEPRTEAALLCDLGDACLKAGANDRAHDAFGAAVEAARGLDDPVLLAEAAIGLGGGLEESVGFQLGVVHDEVLDALVDARASIPEHEPAWRALVTARLAGARYDMGEVVQAQALSAEALELARASGDARALAVALSVRHASLSSADALADRLALDDELARIGAPPSAQAVLWRVSDLLECGRLTEADAAMDEMIEGPLGRSQPRTAWYMAHYRVMRAELDGRLDDAMALADDALELGTRLGGPTVGISHALQTFFIAREQHRLEGVPEILDALVEANPSQPGFAVAGAWARTETGDLDTARAQLDALSPNDFVRLPRNGVWLSNMAVLADVCFALDAQSEAALIYRELLPFRDHYVAVSRMLSYRGSVERSLGTLALTRGDLDVAADHLDRARERNAALGAPLLVARTELLRARVLAARGETDAAAALFDAVRAEAEAHGWTDLALRASAC